MKKELIEQRIMSAIQPQLDALEDLFDRYQPRVIGKHHPEYDTWDGRLHHAARITTRSMRDLHHAMITSSVPQRFTIGTPDPNQPVPPIPDHTHPANTGRYGYLPAGVVPVRR